MSAALDPVADKRAWAALAPAGLVLVGAGTAVANDASARRSSGAGPLVWVAQGTAGLALVGAGLSLFGEAVKRRARHDVALALVERDAAAAQTGGSVGADPGPPHTTP